MMNKIEMLLSEYEQLTGRSPTWREDLSINDFLTLRDYAKKTGGIGVSYTETKPVTTSLKTDELPKSDVSRDNTATQSTNNTVSFDSAKKHDIKKENKVDAVSILKAIKD